MHLAVLELGVCADNANPGDPPQEKKKKKKFPFAPFIQTRIVRFMLTGVGVLLDSATHWELFVAWTLGRRK